MRAQFLFRSIPLVLAMLQPAAAQQTAVLDTDGPFRIWVGTTDSFLNVASEWAELPLEFSFSDSNAEIAINGYAHAELDRGVLIFTVDASTNSSYVTQLLVLLEGPLKMSEILRPRVPFRLTVTPAGIGEFTFSLKTDNGTAGYRSSFLQVGILQLQQFTLRGGLEDALPRTLLIPTLRGDTLHIDASQFLARFPMGRNSAEHYRATGWLSTKEPLFVPEPSRNALHMGGLIGLAMLARATRAARRR